MKPIDKYNKSYAGCHNQFRIGHQINGAVIAGLFFLILILTFTSCKKLVDVNPPVTSVTGASVYNSDATAAAVLSGLYTQISSANYNSSANASTLSMWTALSADELTLWSGASSTTQIAYYTNSLSVVAGGSEFWYSVYPYIFTCNSAIEGLKDATSLTPAVQQQLMGEAKFMRAFLYFYLASLYGDIPIPLSTDYKINSALARTSKAQVFQQIIADLKDAQKLLSIGYLDATLVKATTERTRPTKWAATALLARVYLYNGNWIDAEAQATAVINIPSLYSLSTLKDTFLKNSTEAIWQLQPVNTGHNTEDAQLFIIPVTGPSNTYPVYISNSLLNSFEMGDQRKTSWIDSIMVAGKTYYYPFKYKINTYGASVTEYLMMLRLGEQYLIRSEARAEQGNITGAVSDLNSIRTRAGLANTTSSTQFSILTAIIHERQVELFTELGHRWLDLKRTLIVDAVMTLATPSKGATWKTNQQLYPLPLGDLQKDVNLVQNAGY